MLKWLKERFIKREYINLICDGTPCTMTPSEACETLQDADDPKCYKVESVWITPHQLSRLPEFQGW
jgi:hypothetical protein